MGEYLALWMVISLFVLLLIGFPVAFTLAGVAMVFGWIGLEAGFFDLLPLRIWGIMTNVTLMAVPLFVFMGVTLEKSGLAEDLLEAMAGLFGRIRGGHAYSVIIAGALLAASTGIVGASVVTMGLISLPVMLGRGYPKPFSCGVICASGTLGQIIPPSIVLVLLGDIMGVSVGELFLAAVVPGLLLVGGYLSYAVVFSYGPGAGDISVETEREAGSWKRLLKALVPTGLLIVMVLGSIFFGIASPTEAAAVGAFGALLLSAVHRRLTLSTLREITESTTVLTSMVFMILIGATAFGLVFRGLDGDYMIIDYVTELQHGKWLFIGVAMLVMFFLGCFLDFIEIVFIVVPIIVPVIKELGIDPLWFSVLIAMNLQTSFLTPPLGFSLFFSKVLHHLRCRVAIFTAAFFRLLQFKCWCWDW